MTLTEEAVKSTVRVAAVQAEGVYFDLNGAVDKTCRLIEEAARKGVDLIAFLEVWIPMYPGWIWQRLIDFGKVGEYMKHSLRRDGPEMAKIQNCAATHRIAISLGYSENHNNSLYLPQSVIGKDGEIKMLRRKSKPTHAERTIYGDGSGASLLNVVDEPGLGKPLLRYHTYSQGEQIHVAAWPPMNYYNSVPEGSALWSQCREGGAQLVDHARDRGQLLWDRCDEAGEWEVIPHSRRRVCGHQRPDGRKLTEDLDETEEGLLIADLDFAEIQKVKAILDVHGHYSRPDLLWLGVDYCEKKQVRPAHD
ncbi:carbon-nitrogen hydrolase [Aspergillus pseudoustus]|uniref:nitrilase n=1 Tax=Aspergillus pseudoustus TaxID=1810923 RepID=A0ABR4L0L8_9EURO